MKAILTAACLFLAFPLFADTPEARCGAARDAATTFLAVGSTEAEHTVKWRAAEKHAFVVCTSSDVPVQRRNEAIVRWAGILNDAPAELSLLKKALRETETAEGGASPALLPLIDRLSGLHALTPRHPRER